MDDTEEFIAEIVANPADITPRLIFADWLEEQGDPRGEFIRLQCQWDPAQIATDEQIADRSRERDLLQTYGPRWSAHVAPHCVNYQFIRGFVEYVEIEAATLIEHGPMILKSTPLRVLNLRMSTFGNLRAHSLSEIADTGVFRNLVGLFLEDIPLRVGDFEALADRPDDLSEIERLCLVNCRITETMVELLCQRNMPHLQLLDLGNNSIRNTGVHAICSAAFAPGLRSLTLTNNQIRKKGGHRLATAAWLDNLIELDIRRNQLADSDIALIAERVPNVQL